MQTADSQFNPTAPGTGITPDQIAKPSKKIFILILILLAVLGIAILAGVFYRERQQLVLQPPADYLYATNGEVEHVDLERRQFLIRSTSQDWDKKWQVTINEGTMLATFEDWSRANSLFVQNPVLSAEEILKSVPRIGIDSFREGDTVYLIIDPDSRQNLTVDTEITKTKALLWQFSSAR